MSLTLIKNDESKINKYDLYYRAYARVLDGYRDNPDQDRKTAIKKLTFYGVRTVNGKVFGTEPLEWRFEFADIMKDLMSTLTPAEFINVFPVTKTYDGNRWETKDFFYTMDYASGLNQNEPIGAKIVDFLWEYHNPEIRMFLAHLMSLTSDLRRIEGYPGLMESWAIENGFETYSMHTDSKGKKFMIDSHGKTARVKTSIPKYLRVVR